MVRNSRGIGLLALVCALFLPLPAFAWDPNEGALYEPGTPYARAQTESRRHFSRPAVQPYRAGVGSAYRTSPAPYTGSSGTGHVNVVPTPLPAPSPPTPLPPLLSNTPSPPTPLPPLLSNTPSPPAVTAASVPSAQETAQRQIPEENLHIPPRPVDVVTDSPPVPVLPEPSSVAVQRTGVTLPPMRPLPPAEEEVGTYHARLGLAYFNDNYKEPTLDLDNEAVFFSASARFSYDTEDWFAAFESSVGRGRNDYSSPSGILNDIPEWEFDNRVLIGAVDGKPDVGQWMPYIGIGNRYFRDEMKGLRTDTGAFAYDRRIFQLYIPLGLTYAYEMRDGWTLNPNIELMKLVWGNVSSRLANGGVAGYENIENRQKKGIGIRGELMVGRALSPGVSMEAGPFLRYWDVPDSKTTTDTFGATWLEPENTRLQLGAEMRVRF